MNDQEFLFTVDGRPVRARPGQTIITACDAAGIYIPRLCHHPDLQPAGHCKLCSCYIDGRRASACTMPAAPGMVVISDNDELNNDRRIVLNMLFVEGNHFCPTCEKSGDCELQALAYRLQIPSPSLPYQWQKFDLDASHPDVFIDRNTCVLCSRCIRASRDVDGKSIFGFTGRGRGVRLDIDAEAELDETTFSAIDKAAKICPVGCIIIKRTGYLTPFGQRRFDKTPIGADIEGKESAEPK
jgi:[NiFe] hydrogenase diaphorase moiety small subunit